MPGGLYKAVYKQGGQGGHRLGWREVVTAPISGGIGGNAGFALRAMRPSRAELHRSWSGFVNTSVASLAGGGVEQGAGFADHRFHRWHAPPGRRGWECSL